MLALANVEPPGDRRGLRLSAEALKALYAAMGTADQQPLIQSVLPDRGTTTEEAVMAALDGFDVEQYLLDAGVTGSGLSSVRGRLLGLHLH